MAQGDLNRLLRRVSNALAKDMNSEKGGGSQRFRERLERQVHDVHIDRDKIAEEIYIQLNDFKLSEELSTKEAPVTQGIRRTYGSRTGLTREEPASKIRGLGVSDGFSPAQVKAVERQADQFLEDCFDLAKKGKAGTGTKVTVLEETSKSIVIRFTPNKKNVNVYNAVNDYIFKPAKRRIARDLEKAGFKLDETKERRLFNVGHVTSVSSIKAAKALRAINTGTDRLLKKYDDPLGNEAADFLRLSIMSKFTQLGSPEFAKDFLHNISVVTPEAEATNMTDSDYEQAVLKDVRKSIEQTLDSMPKDWVGQRSSDSIMDLIAKDLFLKASKKIRKTGTLTVNIPNLGAKNTKSSQSREEVIKLPRKKRTPKNVSLATYGGLQLPQANGRRVQQSEVSLVSLVPILNQGLPEIIRSHMGQNGRLVNRTGRFSESAEIVAIDEANFTLGYTYQTDPYATFEQDRARDPRPLIEMSIRDLAKGMMSSRFRMRRV